MSSKPKSGKELAIASTVTMIYNVLSKLFNKYAGVKKDVKKVDSIKNKYSNNKNNKLRSQAVRTRIKQKLEEKNSELSSLANRLNTLHTDNKFSLNQTAERYLELYDRGDRNTIRTNLTNTSLFSDIFTPAFVTNYDESTPIEEGRKDDDDEEDDEGETREEIIERQQEEDRKRREEAEAKFQREQAEAEEKAQKKKKKKKKQEKKIETGTPDVEMQFVEPPKQEDVQPEEKLTYGGLTLTENQWEKLIELNKQRTSGTKHQRRASRTTMTSMIERWRQDQNQDIQTLNDVQAAIADYNQGRRAPPQQQFISTRRGGLVTGKTVTAAGFQKQSEDRIIESQQRSEKRIRGNISNVLTEVQGTRQNVTNAEIRSQEAEQKATEQRNAMLQRQEEIKTILNDINVQYPELQSQARRVSNELKNMRRGDAKQILNSNQIADIVGSMPSEYRGTLGASVSNLLSANANLNSIASGLLGFSTIVLSGNPMIGGLVQQASRYIMDAYGVDLNNILQPTPAPSLATQLQGTKLGEVITEPSKQNLTNQTNEIQELKGEETEGGILDDDLERIILENQQRHVRQILEKVPLDVKQSIDSDLLERFAESYVLSRYMGIQNMRQVLIQDIPFQEIYNQSQFLDFIGDATGVNQTQQQNFNTEIEDEQGFLHYLRNIWPAVRSLIPISIDSLIRRLPTITQINQYLPTFLRFAELDAPQADAPQIAPPPRRDVPQLAPPPSVQQGVVPGMIGAGGAAYMRGGGAIDAVGSLALGAMSGAAVSNMIRRYYEQSGRDLNDPSVIRERKYLETLAPPAVAALLGYYGVGQQFTSGAGITERKITVDPSVLEQTKAVDTQEATDRKKWITKAIMPTPDILDETNQEKFVDDLEFAAFNYIEPGSEGANGNIKTNPLKRTQFLTDQIRYFEAGISTPSMLYNQEFKTNTSQKQMETYKLGQDMLPEMEFLVQDNADTFTPIGKHYVNNEDTAIEMFSPFSDFSDTRNYWAINRKSDLYNLYA